MTGQDLADVSSVALESGVVCFLHIGLVLRFVQRYSIPGDLPPFSYGLHQKSISLPVEYLVLQLTVSMNPRDIFARLHRSKSELMTAMVSVRNHYYIRQLTRRPSNQIRLMRGSYRCVSLWFSQFAIVDG